MVTFQEENDKFMENFIGRTFIEGYRTRFPNWDRLELMLDTSCTLGCKYCYYNNPKHDKYLYPVRLKKPEEYVKNAKMLFEWLYHEKGVVPRGIDIFGGEVTVKPEFYGILDAIEEVFGRNARKISVVIPSNYTFLLSKKWTETLEDYLNNSKINIFLSASIDGKYLEQLQRPLMGNPKIDPRDDEYYDRLFEFNKKYGFGFHPMIYSSGIHLWKKNFLWFQRMFDKFKIPWWGIYLLEVRNPEWTREQIRTFGDFIEFIVKWTFKNRLDEDVKKYVHFTYKLKGYNILNPFGGTGRGLGCSIQAMLYVRLSDLAIVPCHRTSYDEFVYGRFKVENGKIVGVKAKNIELLSSIYSFTAEHQPYCEQCTIKEVCSHGCLGAQYEFTGDLFTPIPTVCALEHEKIRRLIKATKDIGAYEYIISELNPSRQIIWRRIEDGLGV